MATLPANYYNRFDASKNFEQHLFMPGRGLQSAELNEIQSGIMNRMRTVSDAIFKDGDIVRDASVTVDADTGAVQCQSGAIYIQGMVRGVAPASLTVPIAGTFAIGVRLVEEVIDEIADPTLLDPATGTRNYQEPGAMRLRITPIWSTSQGSGGQFFPVYTVIDGVLAAKDAPPNIDILSQSLARYDRDSAGGSYIVTGLELKQLPDQDGKQIYSLAAGRARVYGYSVDLPTSRRIVYDAQPDLRVITSEPHLSSTNGSQRVNFDRTPGTGITSVTITAQKTVNLTHGVTTGAQDTLPDTSVLSIVSVTQGGTTFTPGTDYNLTAGRVDWSPAGSEPAPGSTYSVTYRYLTLATPTAVDDDGFTVTGAITGSLILVTYSWKLPRYDRLIMKPTGETEWISGVAAENFAQMPIAPNDALVIASVYQTWTAARETSSDGVRVVPMPRLAAFDRRMDLLSQLIAQQRLESNIHTRESGSKKGLFTDPFADDSQRDAGTAQTGAIVNGELVLAISGTPIQLSGDILTPQFLNFSTFVALDQPLRTGTMKINPYMAFDRVPARVTLTPAVDRWTEVQTEWESDWTWRWWWGWRWSWWIGRSNREVLTSRTSTAAEFLRQINVTINAEGFGNGESLQSVVFDGVSVPFTPATAGQPGTVTTTITIPPNIPAGTKTVRVTGSAGTTGQATFIGEGTITVETWRRRSWWWWGTGIDPLAQTFTLTENTHVAAIDLWFAVAPTTATMVQIRETTTGLPNNQIVAETQVDRSTILTNGQPTRINFRWPVALQRNTEYSIVVLCNDANGALHVAELGKFDQSANRWITSQPYTVGVLLSSSNASTWTPHQDRDMAFRIIGANFTQLDRTISLGTVNVTDATDLMLSGFGDLPDANSTIDYTLTLPDATVLNIAEGQGVQLPAAITGSVGISARLRGSSSATPVLFPDTQLVAGTLQTSGDYVSRAFKAGTNVTVRVIFEAVLPSGSTVQVFYKGPDLGDTWTAIPQTATGPADDGFTELTHSIANVTEQTVQIKLVINGTSAARPRIRDLRALTI